jgi:serine phosphatase RsbU (regulator of sigma subunit)/type II secretory pathway pseudopilin PulG
MPPPAASPNPGHVASFSGQEIADAASALERGSPDRQTSRVVVVIGLIGVIVTGLGIWAAVRTDRNTEARLLETQTRQAATVLSAAVSSIEQPLVAGLEVQAGVLRERRRSVFVQRFARYVGADQPFVSASLWETNATGSRSMASVGVPPGLNPTKQASFVRKALAVDTSVVERVFVGKQSRIAYALADPDTGLVIYAERAIPANRRAPVDKDSAYAGLDYAIYLGANTTNANMATTDVDPASLPLTGTTFQTSVPFGDKVLTLVTRPRRHLGSALNQRMPGYVLVAGLLLTGAAAFVSRQALTARNRAEADTRTITALYEKVDALYGEQRDLAIGLQRALLPRVIPDIPSLQVAAEYAAGVKGIDIGGDWYSVIGIGKDDFAFVVGDVSGHGVDAVAEMARARFTLRAYLVDGNPPEVALEKCSSQFDIATDGHLVTVIAGIGNMRTGTITMANAGHPRPLLLNEDRTTEFVETALGPPLGVGATTYQATTFTLPWNSTLVCYTDGLIERRGEDIDVGLDRLAGAVETFEPPASESLEVLVSGLLGAMRDEETADDIAILALRRVRT